MTDPHPSHEIEFQLTGSILKDGRIITTVKDIINPDNFHNTICQDIYSAMVKVYEAGLTIDAVTVGDQLQREGKLNSILHDVFTGRAALSNIRNLGNPKNAVSYAQNVQDYWGKREISQLAGKLSYWANNGRRSPDIFADARTEFDGIESKMGTSDIGTVDARQAASLAYDKAAEASAGKVRFTPLGINRLDSFFKVRSKSLTIVAARPGQGKTGFLETITLNVARTKKKLGVGSVAIFSMEMSVEELTNRILSKICNVPANRITDGQMNADEWDRFNDAIAEFEKLPIFINDIAGLSVQKIRTKARKILRHGEDDLLIVDYLQLATSEHNNKNRVEEVGAIARGLKVYASETGTPVIAAAQLSRAIEQRADKRPILSDLRESGSIEQDANNILFIHSEDADEKNIKRIIVAKQRSGATSYTEGYGDVHTHWKAELTQFSDIARFETFGNTPAHGQRESV